MITLKLHKNFTSNHETKIPVKLHSLNHTLGCYVSLACFYEFFYIYIYLFKKEVIIEHVQTSTTKFTSTYSPADLSYFTICVVNIRLGH